MENYLIVKSNYLVEASYKLGLGEQRILHMLISMIKKDDCDFKPYRFTVKEFTNIIDSKSKNMYSYVSQYIESLKSRKLKIVKEKSVLTLNWLSSAEYFKEGYIEICFDPKLKPYLLQLKEKFTKLDLKTLISFSSTYASRIFELVEQYEKIGSREFSIQELKGLLGIDIDEYKLYADFKRRVLLKSLEEINTKTNMNITIEEKKISRRVDSIKFIIKNNANKTTITNIDAMDAIEKVKYIFTDHEIMDIQAKKLLIAAENDLEIIEKVYKYFKDKKSDNFLGLMIEMVKPGNFNEPIKNNAKYNKKVNTFDNYSNQGEYDFEYIEKKLLGWDKEDIDDELKIED